MREILDVGEKKYVILIRDLTEQRRAEKEVREQRDMLAHVDRLNTLGEMAAGIAHEINQPLTAISMYAQSGMRFLRPSNTGVATPRGRTRANSASRRTAPARSSSACRK